MTIKEPFEVSKTYVINAVLDSGVLGSSKNQISLFKYIVDAKYNTAIEGVKTQDIATHVFSRNGDFSTKKDSIVRVEMFRLRANLKSFNQQSERLKLTVPKSSYDLEIQVVQAKIKQIELASVASSKTIAISKFIGAGAIAAISLIALIFTGAFPIEQKVKDCSKFIPNLEISEMRNENVSNETGLNIYVDRVIRGTASQFGHLNVVKDVNNCRHTGVPGYKLEYTLFENENGFNGSLLTASAVNTKIINTSSFSGVFDKTEEQTNGKSRLYYDIVRITNDQLIPSGLVHVNAVKHHWKEEALRTDYSCLAQMHQSFVSDSDEDYYSGLECLKDSYEKGTPILDNWGGLAATYLEQAMGNRESKKDDPFILAKQIMDKVDTRWIENPETTLAKIMYDIVRPDYNDQQLRETLFSAQQTYSTNPNVMTEVSRSLGFILGDWEYAIKAGKRVKRLTSSQNNSIFHVDAAYALLAKSSPDAWLDCLKAYSEHSKMSNLLVNACSKKYAKRDWEDQTDVNLNRLNLKTMHDKKKFLKTMRFESGLVTALLKEQKSNLYD